MGTLEVKQLPCFTPVDPSPPQDHIGNTERCCNWLIIESDEVAFHELDHVLWMSFIVHFDKSIHSSNQKSPPYHKPGQV